MSSGKQRIAKGGMTRRSFGQASAAGAIAPLAHAQGSVTRGAESESLAGEQQLVLSGTQASLEKSLYPAMREHAYPGHFTITADGMHYGADNTWPGLDSWQMAGAYLLVGRCREVLDYFDFVQASQRRDGNIPFAIFPGAEPPGGLDTYLRDAVPRRRIHLQAYCSPRPTGTCEPGRSKVDRPVYALADPRESSERVGADLLPSHCRRDLQGDPV